MGWIEKERHLAFEALPIHGLFFLDGDALGRLMVSETDTPDSAPPYVAWLQGRKLPMIGFPSGEEFELWDTSSSEREGIVHFFGEMDLPYRSTRDEAYQQAEEIAVACGYSVRKRDSTILDVWNIEEAERFTVTYDNDERRVVDVQRLHEPVDPPIHAAHVLINDELKALLLPLDLNTLPDMNTKATVKYFSPDSSWTWYAVQFDGKDLFYGLVIGFEVEFGMFSLSELQSIRGGLNLPVERDLYYEPTTLGELLLRHRSEPSEYAGDNL